METAPLCPPATWHRFWLKVDRRGPDGCWLWTAAKSSQGYGVLGVDGKRWLAHRFAYEMLVGPIPGGMMIDHVWARGCRHRTCVNPAHLEPVSPAENRRRAVDRMIAERKAPPVGPLPETRPEWVTQDEWEQVLEMRARREAS